MVNILMLLEVFLRERNCNISFMRAFSNRFITIPASLPEPDLYCGYERHL